MFYVVERYLTGLSRADLLPGLSRLESAIQNLQGEGSVVRYLGSTVVLGDEACFCEFEGPSEEAVAEANAERACPFDRIVPALLVDSYHRRGGMSVSTSISHTAKLGRSHRPVVVAALAVVIAVAAWAIVTYAIGSGTRTTSGGTPAQASVLSGLTPKQRQYVLGIVALTPAQLRAAFGTDWSTSDSGGLASLTPAERRYVQAIAGMSRSKQAAAFGSDPQSLAVTER
jgi:hypothetical protein